MEKMWSTWRSQYIESFLQKKEKEKCIFCGRENENIEEESSLIVDKGDYTFTLLNLYPYNNGHLMVVPFRHLSDFSSLIQKEHIEIMEKIGKCCKALEMISKPDGFNIGANIGKSSGAGIEDHLHFHIVPRWNGDTNFMPVIGEIKVLSQDLLKTKKLLIDAFKKMG